MEAQEHEMQEKSVYEKLQQDLNEAEQTVGYFNPFLTNSVANVTHSITSLILHRNVAVNSRKNLKIFMRAFSKARHQVCISFIPLFYSDPSYNQTFRKRTTLKRLSGQLTRITSLHRIVSIRRVKLSVVSATLLLPWRTA